MMTIEQINKVQDDAAGRGDREIVMLCYEALGYSRVAFVPLTETEQRRAAARLSARVGGGL